MAHWRDSGLVILLALLSCTTLIEYRDISNVSAPDVHPYVDAVYKIKVEPDTIGAGRAASAVGVKIEKDGDNYMLTCLTAKHVISQDTTNTYSYYICTMRRDTYGVETDQILDRYKVAFIDQHSVFDIAIVRVLVDKELPVMKLNFDPLHALQEIYTVGFPFDEGKMIKNGEITYFDTSMLRYIVSADGAPGMSGGAIIDRKTNTLIGIITNIYFLQDYYTSDGRPTGNQFITWMIYNIMLVQIQDWLVERGL